MEWNPPNLFFVSRNSEKKRAASQRPLTQQLLAPVPSRLCRANQTEPAGWEILRAEGQMDGVKALVVLASIYYPGDGIVAKNTQHRAQRPLERRTLGRGLIVPLP